MNTMCQSKEQDEDASNTQYFDLLDQVLSDCQPPNNLSLRNTAVDVVYQLVIICPGALTMTVLPKIVPVLVEVIHECMETPSPSVEMKHLQEGA